MKKSLPVLLSLALVLSVFIVAPRTTKAADANAIVNQINALNNGLAAAIGSTLNTVIVTGSVTGATEVLSLNLNDSVTLDWQAEYSGDAIILLFITMTGTTSALHVSDSWISNTGSGSAIYASGSVRVTVSGGTVSADAGAGNAISVVGTLEIKSGKVDVANSSDCAALHAAGLYPLHAAADAAT